MVCLNSVLFINQRSLMTLKTHLPPLVCRPAEVVTNTNSVQVKFWKEDYYMTWKPAAGKPENETTVFETCIYFQGGTFCLYGFFICYFKISLFHLVHSQSPAVNNRNHYMGVNGILTSFFWGSNTPSLLAAESNEWGILLKLVLVVIIKGHWLALTFQSQICLDVWSGHCNEIIMTKTLY